MDSGFPARVRACVCFPGAPTYRSGLTGSEIDYFLVSDCLLPMVASTTIQEESPVAKHYPVVLEFKARVEVDVLVSKLSSPVVPPLP